MEEDAPLDYMLDQAAALAAPGREELQAIVARSGRRRTRIMAAGMAATLAVGGVAGWVAASGGSSGGTSVAVDRPVSSTTVAAPRAALASGSAVAGPVLGGAIGKSLTKKFVRSTTDGVTIRGYSPATPPNTPQPSAGCGFVFPGFEAEVSTADIVGQAGGGFSPQTTQGPMESVQPTTLGLPEGAPVWVVTTKTAPSVAQVRVTFADGRTDQMTPVDGWSVLAHVSPSPTSPALPTGTVEAIDGSGKVVATKSLLEDIAPPKTILVPPPNAPIPGGSSLGGANTATGAPAIGSTTGGTITVPPNLKPGQILPACPLPAPLPPGTAGGAPSAAMIIPAPPGVTTTVQASTGK